MTKLEVLGIKHATIKIVEYGTSTYTMKRSANITHEEDRKMFTGALGGSVG